MRRTVLILPTLACNANCIYCYVDPTLKAQPQLIYQSFERVAQRLQEYLCNNPEDEINCLWHGGEPSLLPLAYWEDVETHLRKYEVSRISKSVQTNLITDEKEKYQWLLDHGYSISSSLDGSFEQHHNGRNISPRQYKNLIDNISYIRERREKMGVVCVVSRAQIYNPSSLLNFFEDLRINVRFNRVVGENWENHLTFREFYEFLEKIAAEWLNNPLSTISVEPIESDAASLLGDTSRSACDRSKSCMNYFLAIDPEGNYYPCNHFVGDKQWISGNIENQSFDWYWKFGTESVNAAINAVISNCSSCKWSLLCSGGCKNLALSLSLEKQSEYCDAIDHYFQTLTNILLQKQHG